MKLLAMAALAALLAWPATAQNVPCGPADEAGAMLTERYGEVVVDEKTGTTEQGSEVLWQVWASDTLGTWSFTGTLGRAMCLFASGRDYEGQTVQIMLLRLGIGEGEAL